jgi:hypothetical protein
VFCTFCLNYWIGSRHSYSIFGNDMPGYGLDPMRLVDSSAASSRLATSMPLAPPSRTRKLVRADPCLSVISRELSTRPIPVANHSALRRPPSLLSARRTSLACKIWAVTCTNGYAWLAALDAGIDGSVGRGIGGAYSHRIPPGDWDLGQSIAKASLQWLCSCQLLVRPSTWERRFYLCLLIIFYRSRY